VTTLAASGVTVRFGHGERGLTAVDRVDLELPAGETVGLVGESGSGKSTLARALSGLVPVAEGEILLDGASVPKRHGGRAVDRRRRVQMIFQDPFSSLNPRMTVGEAIGEAAGAGRGGPRRGARREKVQQSLELVHLDPELADRYPSRLSGGQRQRVAIARALAARPEVLIADEITSSLDVSVQSAVLNLMRDLRRELGISMMFVSHNLATVRYLSDHIAVMYLGRIVEIGPTETVVSDPRHPYTRALLRAVPRLGASPAETAAEVELGDPPDPHRPPAGCHFHPRCPIGPKVEPDRTICIEQDPREGAADRPHRTFCHFASSSPGRTPAAPPATREEQFHVARDR
jgi:peptide/nickel transport system ATP-binding protein